MVAFTIDEIAIPAGLDEPAAADFMECIAIGNAIEELGYGTSELTFSAAESLPNYLDFENQPRRVFLARVDGRAVARAVYERSAQDADIVWVRIGVLLRFRRQGIGTGLADLLEQMARRDGAVRMITYAVSADSPGERLASPTGLGSVPADNEEVRFLVERGFTLEQVERASRLALPMAETDLRQRVQKAMDTAGPDYRLHFWTNRTPPCWQQDMADLYTTMSIEEPSAGLDEPPETWTVERLVHSEERETTSSRTILYCVLEHRASGRLVGHTVLDLPRDPDRVILQGDTLVVPGHRGHRLGMLLKVANLQKIHREYPGHPAIITFNAEENRHMLDVNERVGFLPIGSEGAWKKLLTDPRDTQAAEVQSL